MIVLTVAESTHSLRLVCRRESLALSSLDLLALFERFNL